MDNMENNLESLSDEKNHPQHAMKNLPISDSGGALQSGDMENNSTHSALGIDPPVILDSSKTLTEFGLPRKDALVSIADQERDKTSDIPGSANAGGIPPVVPPLLPLDEHASAIATESPETRLPLTDEAILQRTRSLWREVEPSDPFDPVDATATMQKQGNGGEILVGASRRGRSHAHDGKYREDSFAFDVQNAWILIAVADGTGSKPLARVGSRIAANSAVEYLKTRLTHLQTNEQVPALLRGALAGAMVHALAKIADEASSRQKEANDFATTLLLVVYGSFEKKKWLGIAQVGDGGMAIQKQNGECIQVGHADHGQFGGEAVFLTSQEAQMSWHQRAFVYEVQDSFQRLIVATDGVFDDFSPPFGQTERLFQELHPMDEQEDAAKWLLEWLNYERRGSFDDRTIVVLTPNDR